MPARKGTRNVDLLVQLQNRVANDGKTYEYVVGRKPLKHGERTYAPGEVIPNADAEFPRIDALTSQGLLVRREVSSPPTEEQPSS